MCYIYVYIYIYYMCVCYIIHTANQLIIAIIILSAINERRPGVPSAEGIQLHRASGMVQAAGRRLVTCPF